MRESEPPPAPALLAAAGAVAAQPPSSGNDTKADNRSPERRLGETLDICHIIGVSPQWVVLTIRDPVGRWSAVRFAALHCVNSDIRTQLARPSHGFARLSV